VSNSLAVSPVGTKVFVTGGTQTGTSAGEDYATVALSPATGHELWLRTFDRISSDEATSVAVSPNSAEIAVTSPTSSTIAYSTS
jgi:hypothetical protein